MKTRQWIVPLGTLALLVGAVQTGAAQIQPGDVVRITAPGVLRSRTVGEVITLTDTTLTVHLRQSRRRPSEVDTIRLGDITQLERRVGSKSNVGKGFLIGGVALAVIPGIATIPACIEGDDPNASGAISNYCPVLGLVTGAAFFLGGLLGAAIGAAAPSNVWAVEPLQAPATLLFGITQTDVRLGLSVAF